MDPLTITLLVIFGTTVIATVIQRRSRDVCLKKFQGDLVFVKLKTGLWIWGRIHVHAKSLELLYESPHPDPAGHQELSYLFFEDLLPQIEVILRPSPREGTRAYAQWRREIKKIAARSVVFRARRFFRNLFNTLRDAFAHSVGAVAGHVRARNAAFLPAAEQRLAATSQAIASVGNNAYEPILEQYLGLDVVAQITRENKSTEHIGTLQEYTDKFILLRDVKLHPVFSPPPECAASRVDIAFPRAHSSVRHLALRAD
jgi:hypothetical protein